MREAQGALELTGQREATAAAVSLALLRLHEMGRRRSPWTTKEPPVITNQTCINPKSDNDSKFQTFSSTSDYQQACNPTLKGIPNWAIDRIHSWKLLSNWEGNQLTLHLWTARSPLRMRGYASTLEHTRMCRLPLAARAATRPTNRCSPSHAAAEVWSAVCDCGCGGDWIGGLRWGLRTLAGRIRLRPQSACNGPTSTKKAQLSYCVEVGPVFFLSFISLFSKF
jgi:hypothetical protein